MSKPIFRVCVVFASWLLMSACTDTVIREVPADRDAAAIDSDSTLADSDTTTTGSETSTGSTLGDGSNMVSVPDGQLSDPTTDPATDPEAGTDTETNSDQQPTEPDTDMTTGDSKNIANCEQTLPCQWVSEDSQFTLTVTNADNIATRSRLAIYYSIITTHDTEIQVSVADNAIDSEGMLFLATDQTLGAGNGITPQGLNAGTVLEGVMNFNMESTNDELASWSVSILDGGLLRTASFTGIPVGPVTTARADCQNTLPCIWTTPKKDVAITLQSVSGHTVGSNLLINFSMETTTKMSIAVDAGAEAVGIDGLDFEGRTHSIGNDVGFGKVSASIQAGVTKYGTINFYRTEKVPSSLQILALVLYQDNPVPRWNPQFINVPVR